MSIAGLRLRYGPVTKAFDFQLAPGHLIRRANQVAISMFMAEVGPYGSTPIQFAILNALIDDPGADQIGLAARVGADAATSGMVIGRLESRGWIRRTTDPLDKRRRRVWITDDGASAAAQMTRAVRRAQSRLLAPLDAGESERLLDLLGKLINDLGDDAPGPVLDQGAT